MFSDFFNMLFLVFFIPFRENSFFSFLFHLIYSFLFLGFKLLFFKVLFYFIGTSLITDFLLML